MIVVAFCLDLVDAAEVMALMLPKNSTLCTNSLKVNHADNIKYFLVQQADILLLLLGTCFVRGVNTVTRICPSGVLCSRLLFLRNVFFLFEFGIVLGCSFDNCEQFQLFILVLFERLNFDDDLGHIERLIFEIALVVFLLHELDQRDILREILDVVGFDHHDFAVLGTNHLKLLVAFNDHSVETAFAEGVPADGQ